MEEFCKKIPKIELHAHLNGSISESTIRKMTIKQSDILTDGNFKNCFDKFKIIHEIVNSTEAVKLITTDIINEFRDDNVKYLELRSTPKQFDKKGTTKHDYISAIIDAINTFNYNNNDIDVRYLVSINREHGIREAEEAVKLAKAFKSMSDIVVGIDFSGNPFKGRVSNYINILQDAKYDGLKLSMHVAETTSKADETRQLVDIGPNRIGHGTYLDESSEAYNRVVQDKIPLEIAITSNIKCGTAASVKDHHITNWLALNHPVLISTDDKGVFDTSLSQEYVKAACACNLSRDKIFEMSLQSIDHIFENENAKARLKNIWEDFLQDFNKNDKNLL